MNRSLCGIILLFMPFLPMALAATVLYDGSATLPTGWRVGGWKGLSSGIDASASHPGGSAAWIIQPKSPEAVEAWAGAKLLALPKQAISLAPDQWKTDYLNLLLRREGDNIDSNVPLQVCLDVALKDGSVAHTKPLRIAPYVVSGKGNFSNWFKISIPLSEMVLKSGSEEISGICGVSLQYTENHPVLARLYVGNIEIGKAPYPATGAANSALPAATLSRFPELSQLKPPFLLPPGARFEIDHNGNFTFEKRPRFIIGAEMSTRLHLMTMPTSGYPRELAWIYEAPLNYTSAQRLGIDSVGIYMPATWQVHWDPEPAINARILESDGSAKTAENIISQLKLPVYVDFSVIPTLNGILSHSDKIPEEAKNHFQNNNHYSDYAMLAPAGRALYMAMYKNGAEIMQRTKATPLYYELLNEPAYDDPSACNRAAFVAELAKHYGTVSSLNVAWATSYKNFEEIGDFKSRSDNPALFVEWCKFMEDVVVGLCREGISVISSVDKNDPHFAVQTMGGDFYRVLPKSNVNIFKLSQLTQVVSLPTRGGLEEAGAGGLSCAPKHTIETPYVSQQFEGMVLRRFFLSLAEGKPLVDGEHYFYQHTASDGFWLQLARGGSAAFIFAWEKRAWDWTPDTGPEAGRKQAQRFPYNVLNPYAQSPDSLADISVAKEEILGLDDIFVPRQNRSKPEIALLLSYPTVRYAQATGTTDHNAIRNYGVALDFAHYNYAVIPEEQIPEGKLNNYKTLILPAVGNIYEGTALAIEKWVEAGGTLVLALASMQENELGRPTDESKWLDLKLGPVLDTPASILSGTFPRDLSVPGDISASPHRAILEARGWDTLALLNKQAALLSRRLGKGRIYFVNARMSDYPLISVLGGILKQSGCLPDVDLTRIDNGELEVNVESHRFVSGLVGYFLYNWDLYPKVFTFRSRDLSKGSAIVDPLNRQGFKVQDGATTLWLPPGTKRVLVAGNADALTARFGVLPTLGKEEVIAAAASSKTTAPTTVQKDDFSVPGDKVNTLDLRPFANRGFHDQKAGDGRGGWTDEGENSLYGEQWGRNTYRGVPFEIIRPDMNGDNGVIVLASQSTSNLPDHVNGIPLGDGGGEKAKRIFFLHTTAWSESGTLAFSYLVHYADGSTTEIPVHDGKEVADWWINGAQGNRGKDISDQTKVAWTNIQHRGFWMYAWTNPKPNDPISKIDIVSAKNKPIPIVVGITVEME